MPTNTPTGLPTVQPPPLDTAPDSRVGNGSADALACASAPLSIPEFRTTGVAMWAPNIDPALYSIWDGTEFGSATSAAILQVRYRIMAGAASPASDEKVVVGVDNGNDIYGQMWNGSSWSGLSINPMATDVTESFWWGADVAYEQQSGDAVAVWNDSADLRYSVWNGITWTTPATITAYTGDEPKQIQLAAKPGADEMVVVVGSSSQGDYGLVWSGSSWGNQVTLDSAVAGSDKTDVYVAYEQQSGQVMAVYGKDADANGYYRIWNGTSWSGEGTISPPTGVTDRASWLTLGADPSSDRIALGVLSAGADVWLTVWDGTSSWETATIATTAADTTVAPNIAVAFESDSGEALATYGKSGATSAYYRTWSSGSGWSSSEGTAAGVGHATNSMMLDSDPNSDRIMLLVQDDDKDLNTVLWDGTSWGAPSQQEDDTGETKNQPFVFLWSQTGATRSVEVRVAASTDDGEEEGSDGNSPGTMHTNSTDLELIRDDEPTAYGAQQVGMRFNGISVPQGATITNAYIRFRAIPPDAPNTNNNSADLTIEGQTADNPSAFSSTSYDISNRARSTASVNWAPAAWTTGNDYDTSDISSVVQELVNRSGWGSGNSMVFIVRCRTGVSPLSNCGSRSADSYDGSITTAPLLHVEWELAASGAMTFSPTKDTFLNGEGKKQVKNYGTCDYFRTDQESDKPEHALLQFDLSDIPSTCTIDSASLVLKVTGVQDNTAFTVNAHRVTSEWTEGTGCDADGVANWNDRMTSTSWGSAGGDYDASLAGSTSVSTVGVYTWTITSLVEDWIDGTYTNHGLLLRTPAVTGDKWKEYASRENSTEADQPRLEVTYRCEADLSIAKADTPDPVAPSGTLTYTLTISNAGPSSATALTVTDTLPTGVTFVSATPTESSGPNPLVWELSDLDVSASTVITVLVTVDPATTGTITNTASVGAAEIDPSTANNSVSQVTTIAQPPSVSVVALYESTRSTTVTSMDPQVEYAVKVTVSDGDTLADLSTVKVTIFYDSDGDDDPGDVPSSGNTQNAAILTCTVGATPVWSIDPSASTTWVLVEGNCVQPSLTGTSGDFWFHFKPGKVATEATDWDAYAVADDGVFSPATRYDGSDYDMNWYGEITINTGSVDWGTVNLGSDFGDNVQSSISATYISNGSYNQGVKSDSSWTGGAASVTLDGAGSPGEGEFSLKANDLNELGTAVPVSTSYATIDSGSQTNESGNVEAANTLWMKMGASGIPDVTYSGFIYYQIAQ